MGAPRRWIKQFLGLKKSEKIASSEEEEKVESKSGSNVESWKQSKKGAEIENENVETEFEDANWQWELDNQSSAASSSKNGAHVPQERTDEWQDDGKMEAELDSRDWREEWMGGVYGKDAAHFESAVDSPTSPEAQAQLEQDPVEGWATPDVREIFEPESDPDPDPDPDPTTSPPSTYGAIFQENTGEESDGEDDSDANSDANSSPSTLLGVQTVPHLDQKMQQELAARCIQTVVRGYLMHNGAATRLPMTPDSAARCIQAVYRGFLARRAFRALKGLARLQALANGHTVKRQAAIALRCIQALVKVQARSRAKHVRTSLESQAVQQKLMQQLEHEAPPVKKDEQFAFNGWCDKAGSAREVQARLLKRKEAAAKREKAKAYALARQWQAGIRQQPQPQPPQQQQQQQQQQQHQPAPVGFHSEKSEWGWNWLEKWMAVRPWETQLFDDASERGAAVDVPTMSHISTERKPMTSNANEKSSPRVSSSATKHLNEKRAITAQVDGCSPSPRKLQEATPTTPVSSRSPRTSLKDSVTAKPSIGSRSFSTPRERSTLSVSDNQDKKRLSLPGTMNGARLLAQTAVNSPRTQSPRTLSPRVQSPRTPQKPGNPRSKLNGSDAKTSKLSR